MAEWQCEGCGSTFATEEELETHLAANPIYLMTGSHLTLREWETYYMGGIIDRYEAHDYDEPSSEPEGEPDSPEESKPETVDDVPF